MHVPYFYCFSSLFAVYLEEYFSVGLEVVRDDHHGILELLWCITRINLHQIRDALEYLPEFCKKAL